MARRETSMAEAVRWLRSPEACATEVEVEAEAARQTRDRETGTQFGAIWCNSEEQEARLAGAIAGIWGKSKLEVSLGGSVEVVLPNRGVLHEFKSGLARGAGGDLDQDCLEDRKHHVVALKLDGREGELRFRIGGRGAVGLGFGRTGPLQGAFICGSANFRRHAEDGYAGILGSLSGSHNMVWYFASAPRVWNAGGSTPLARATDASFWGCVSAGRMYARHINPRGVGKMSAQRLA